MKRKATSSLKRGNVKRRRTMRSQQVPSTLLEKKGVDTRLAINPILDTTNSAGSSHALNLIAPGTGSFNRIGRKVKLSGVRLKGNVLFSINQAATTGNLGGNQVRMVVVWDKQPSGSGTLPQFDTIFGCTSQAGTETSEYMDSIRYDNMGRFQILRDVFITCNPESENQATGTENYVLYTFKFDEYIKLGGRETVYGAQTSPAVIGDISTGGLYVYFRAERNSVNSFAEVEDNSFARLRYFG